MGPRRPIPHVRLAGPGEHCTKSVLLVHVRCCHSVRQSTVQLMQCLAVENSRENSPTHEVHSQCRRHAPPSCRSTEGKV